jgi:HSP20 family molecular chaperone IbpA
MAEKTVAVPTSQQVEPSAERTLARERYITPPVDIYEMPESLVVTADVPGVPQEELTIRVDNNVLTIQGRARHVVTNESMHREYELVNVFRQFELTDTVDQTRISADLKHGVLTLVLPKAEAAKPRQIPVRVS